MKYRCNRCPDGTQVTDVAGCVEHAAAVHRSTRLRFEDFTALGGSRRDQRRTTRESRTPQHGQQLALDLTLETTT